jgi:homoserine O-succinyltransferase
MTKQRLILSEYESTILRGKFSMSVKVSNNLPSIKKLREENIFVMTDDQANTQDIRPLRIAILNLMPQAAKPATERQLLRLLSNSPLQVEVEFVAPEYEGKNTDKSYLDAYYKTFSEIKSQKFDGLIVTGAAVEKLKFEDVGYWSELKEILAWAKKNVHSSFFICWAAQAALYHHFGIQKYMLKQKLSGIYPHTLESPHNPLVRGFDETFFAPHSRYTETKRSCIERIPQLEILASSKKAGVYLSATKDNKMVFVTGHGEYDRDTLKLEYERDKNLGFEISAPKNYFSDKLCAKAAAMTWRSHSMLLFGNWLNYCVYQTTPYDIEKI